jgi:hypothetical protein
VLIRLIYLLMVRVLGWLALPRASTGTSFPATPQAGLPT